MTLSTTYRLGTSSLPAASASSLPTWSFDTDLNSSRRARTCVTAAFSCCGVNVGLLPPPMTRHPPGLTLYVATKIPPKNFKWPSRRGYKLDDCFPPDHIREYAEKLKDPNSQKEREAFRTKMNFICRIEGKPPEGQST